MKVASVPTFSQSSSAKPAVAAPANAEATATPADSVEISKPSSGPSRARIVTTGVVTSAVVGLTAGLAFSGNGWVSGIAGTVVGVGAGACAGWQGLSMLQGGPKGAGTGFGIAAVNAFGAIAGAAAGGIGGAMLAANYGNHMAGMVIGAGAALATGVSIYRLEHKSH